MENINNLRVKIFADGADKEDMLAMSKKTFIKGLTTNPTLMRKAGIKNYKDFCFDILEYIKDKPISFEVFSDEFSEMKRQAIEIASWAKNVYVKIPISNTKREYSYSLIKELSDLGISLNVTAIMTEEQVDNVAKVLNPNIPSYVSVFAGRIADTGRDPVPMMQRAVKTLSSFPMAELIWASPRELLNIFQADSIGCHIITVTPEILGKLKMIGYSLEDYSLDTVKMFYEDAKNAQYIL